MKKALFIVVALLAISTVSYGEYLLLNDFDADGGNTFYWTAANGATLTAQTTYGVVSGTHAMEVVLDPTKGGADYGKRDQDAPAHDFSLYDTIDMDVFIRDAEWDTDVDLSKMTISTEGGGEWIPFYAPDATWTNGSGDAQLHLIWDISDYDIDGGGWESLRWNPVYADAGVGNLYIDNLAFDAIPFVEPVRGQAHTPVPSDGDDLVDSDVVSSVSWYSPLQDPNGLPITDPNIVSVDSYDITYVIIPTDEVLETDPNGFILGPAYTVVFDDDVTPPYPISLDYYETFFWRVDTHITFNSDEVTGNLSDVAEGEIWEFSTLEEYYAPAITFNNVITDMSLLPEYLSATVVPGRPAIPITSATLTYLADDFEHPAGAVVTFVDTTSNLENPTATLDTNLPGTYKVKLVVSDGFTTQEKTIEVVVYDDACQAKKASPGGWAANYYDRDNDCDVDLVDFSVFALEWLDNTAMAIQEDYPGAAWSLPTAVFNARIEAEDVYSLTDPNFVTEAPLTDTGSPAITTGAGNDWSGDAILANTGTSPGCFITHEIDIPTTGAYTVYLLTAHDADSDGLARSLSFGTVSPDGDPSNDNVAAYGTVDIAYNTDWSGYVVDSGTVTFTATGPQLVRMTWAENAAFNFDFFALEKQ